MLFPLLQMISCRFLVFSIFTIYGIEAQHNWPWENKMKADWTMAGQEVVREASKVFQRALTNLNSMTLDYDDDSMASTYVHSLAKYSPKIASVLGVAGALFSAMFSSNPTSKTESSKLDLLYSEFDELLQQIDTIAQSTDDTMSLENYEEQETSFLALESDIDTSYSTMNTCLMNLQNISCNDMNECKRKKMETVRVCTLNVERDQLKNVRGKVQKVLKSVTVNSASSRSLLVLNKMGSRCDIPLINRFANRVVTSLIKGITVALFRNVIKIDSYEYLVDGVQANSMLYKLEHARQKIEDSCLGKINYWLRTDIAHLRDIFSRDSRETNGFVMNRLNEKYPWVYWYVLTMQGDKPPIRGPWGTRRSRFYSSSIDKQMHAFVIPASTGDVDDYDVKLDEWKTLLEEIPFGSKRVKKGKNLWSHPTRQVNWIASKIRTSIELNGQVQSFVFLSGADITLRYIKPSGHVEEVVLTENKTEFSSMNVHLSRVRSDVAAVVTFHVADKPRCSKSCNKRGECYFCPYSTEMACRCKKSFTGDYCELSTLDIRHQSDLNTLLTSTMKLPVFTAMRHTLDDIQLYHKASLIDAKHSIRRLAEEINGKFKDLGEFKFNTMDDDNLLVTYSRAIEKLVYFRILTKQEMKSLQSNVSILNVRDPQPPLIEARTEDVDIARYLLGPTGILEWLYQMDALIKGRNHTILSSHQPYIFMKMDKYQNQLCYPEYKAEIDRTFKQLTYLQLQAYVIAIYAYTILNRKSVGLVNKYNTALRMQSKHLMMISCPEINIEHSKNFPNCSGGLYIYPSLPIPDVVCEDGHYLKGE